MTLMRDSEVILIGVIIGASSKRFQVKSSHLYLGRVAPSAIGWYHNMKRGYSNSHFKLAESIWSLLDWMIAFESLTF